MISICNEEHKIASYLKLKKRWPFISKLDIFGQNSPRNVSQSSARKARPNLQLWFCSPHVSNTKEQLFYIVESLLVAIELLQGCPKKM